MAGLTRSARHRRQAGGPRGLVAGDVRFPTKSEADVVQTLDESPPSVGVDRERLLAGGRRDSERLQVDGDLAPRIHLGETHQPLDGRRGKLHSEEPDLPAVVAEDVGERRRDDRAESRVLEGPYSMLAARAASEVRAREEDRCAPESRIVEGERRIRSPLGEQERTEARALDALQVLGRNDLVRIDVRAVEWKRASRVRCERPHVFIRWTTFLA